MELFLWLQLCSNPWKPSIFVLWALGWEFSSGKCSAGHWLCSKRKRTWLGVIQIEMQVRPQEPVCSPRKRMKRRKKKKITPIFCFMRWGKLFFNIHKSNPKGLKLNALLPFKPAVIDPAIPDSVLQLGHDAGYSPPTSSLCTPTIIPLQCIFIPLSFPQLNSLPWFHV